ncbi:MAG: Gfo/Idh/MocA family oxidoreductase [Firmicutes bacterium]|nr:Gfo/Idh/MocA family oxidoreductase [Bacillota bacterium]
MIKFGVMGAGRISASFSSAVNGINEHLYAIASRNLLKAETFKNKYHYQVAYGSYEEMLDDPLVDCVYIATPHSFHFDQMKLCLEKGKHILCEKSFTLNHKQAIIIYELARRKHLFVMEAMWTRFLPTLLEVKKLIDQDEIGEIIQIDATFGFKAEMDLQNRLFNLNLGGGALLDVGLYTLTLANLFLGVPDNIESTVVMSKEGIDLSETITYFYPHAQAVLMASLVEDLGTDAYIYGTKGYFHIPSFHSANLAILYNNNHKALREIEHKHIVNGLEYEIFETIKCIKKKSIESPLMTHENSIEILRQMDHLRKKWNLVYPQELG